jgi:hypothetical protein
MPNTFTLIASSTVGAGGTVSITFSSIPATYTDLLIKCSLRGTQSAAVYTDVDVILTGGSYSSGKVLYAINGSTVGSYSPGTNAFIAEAVGPAATSNTFSNSEIYIPNYTSSANKSASGDAVGENNASATIAILGAALYTSSSAITGVTLTYGTGSLGDFVQYSTAYLYGIKKD